MVPEPLMRALDHPAYRNYLPPGHLMHPGGFCYDQQEIV